MRFFLRKIGTGLTVLIALPFIFAAFVALFNLYDDELDPEIEKLLVAEPAQIPAEENAYFTWLGLLGPADQAPHAWGYRWYQEALQADKISLGSEYKAMAIEAEKREDGLSKKDFACAEIKSCLGAVAKSPDDARALLEKGRIILERGDMAIAMPAYQEAWRPGFSVASPFPSYANYYLQLSTTRFALAVAEGRHDQALDYLGRQIAFHTRQMQGAATLIEKMVAMGSLQANIYLLNQYILHAPDAARARADRLVAMLAPLPREATRMRDVIQTELRVSTALFLSLGNANIFSKTGKLEEKYWDKWLNSAVSKRLYLPHTSANEHFRMHGRVLAADELTDDAYRRALADAHEHYVKAEKESPYVLRNPIGHILVKVGLTDFRDYFLRRDDLLAQHAAVAFQVELLRQNITDANAIARAMPALIHPYTGFAPLWDKANRTLIHAALPERRNKTLEIQL